MLEKEIQAQVLEQLRQIGIFCWKNHSTGVYDPRKGIFRKGGMTGVSDIIGIINGRMLAIEVKSATGKLSEEQRIFLAKVNENQGVGFVVRSVKDLYLNLHQFFPENPLYKRNLDLFTKKQC